MAWYGAVQQILLQKPFSSNPAPDAIMIVVWAIFGVSFGIERIWGYGIRYRENGKAYSISSDRGVQKV
jgi:hypothetical protein